MEPMTGLRFDCQLIQLTNNFHIETLRLVSSIGLCFKVSYMFSFGHQCHSQEWPPQLGSMFETSILAWSYSDASFWRGHKNVSMAEVVGYAKSIALTRFREAGLERKRVCRQFHTMTIPPSNTSTKKLLGPSCSNTIIKQLQNLALNALPKVCLSWANRNSFTFWSVWKVVINGIERFWRFWSPIPPPRKKLHRWFFDQNWQSWFFQTRFIIFNILHSGNFPKIALLDLKLEKGQKKFARVPPYGARPRLVNDWWKIFLSMNWSLTSSKFVGKLTWREISRGEKFHLARILSWREISHGEKFHLARHFTWRAPQRGALHVECDRSLAFAI